MEIKQYTEKKIVTHNTHAHTYTHKLLIQIHKLMSKLNLTINL